MSNNIRWFMEYKVHPSQEGWHVFKQPSDPRCRAIEYAGPLSREDAEKYIQRMEDTNP